MASYLSQLTSYLGSTPVVPAVPAAAAQRVLSQVDEAFGIQGSSEKKADEVAQDAFDEFFEKKESVSMYGYLPSFNLGTVKSLYGWATGAGTEVPEKTPELKQESSGPQNIQSSIRKVIQAYQNYATSLRAIDAANQQLSNNNIDRVEALLSAVKVSREKDKRMADFLEAFGNLEKMIRDEQRTGEKSEASCDAYDRVMSEMYDAFRAQGVTKEQVDDLII